MPKTLCNLGARIVTINPILDCDKDLSAIVVHIDGPTSKRIAVLTGFECDFFWRTDEWSSQGGDLIATLFNTADFAADDASEFDFKAEGISIIKFEANETDFHRSCYAFEITNRMRAIFWGGAIFNVTG